MIIFVHSIAGGSSHVLRSVERVASFEDLQARRMVVFERKAWFARGKGPGERPGKWRGAGNCWNMGKRNRGFSEQRREQS